MIKRHQIQIVVFCHSADEKSWFYFDKINPVFLLLLLLFVDRIYLECSLGSYSRRRASMECGLMTSNMFYESSSYDKFTDIQRRRADEYESL